MIIWMLYVVLVAALLTSAAHLCDQALRRAQAPRRWLWFLALAGASILPWVGPHFARPAPGADAFLGAATVVAAGPDALPAAASRTPMERLSRLDGVASVLWGTTTCGLLLALLGSAVALNLRVRRQPVERAAGLRIRRGGSLGPAVVGILRPTVILPTWVESIDDGDTGLILAHEREHLRAGDNLFVLFAYLFVVTMPFNPCAWILFRRYRAAVEEDCDQRVLRGRAWPEQRRYGELLVQVGRRLSTGTRMPTPAAFAESGSHLERRIRSMYQLDPPATPRRIALSLAAGVLLITGACMVPGPDAPTLTEPDLTDADVTASPVGQGAVVEGPDFTPFTRAPELVNPAEIRQAVTAEYPPLLRDAGIGGQVRVWLYVDATGTVTDLRIDESSGHQGLDAAALRVAGEMDFSPALNGDEPVPVWIAMPVAFGRAVVEGDDRVVVGDEGPPVDLATVGDEPTWTPYTVAPDLVNRSAVGAALEANYPQELRDAGIGGTARVWFFIDAAGAVADVRLQEPSGHEAIDDAALRVARTMEFTPALNRDEPVPVWVAFPITFMVR